MTIDFESLLTREQKENILQQRIQQFAAEAWQHTLNRETCVAVGDQQGVESADSALDVLAAAIGVHQQKLSELGS